MSSQLNSTSSVFARLFDNLKEDRHRAGWSEIVQLSAGPSKWDIMLALFHGRSSEPHLIEVQAKTGETYSLRLNSVSRESGSGENWILEGFSPGGPNDTSVEFSAFFSTRDRCGAIRFKCN